MLRSLKMFCFSVVKIAAIAGATLVCIQKRPIHASDTVKATIRKFILVVNYTIAVVICLALVAQPQVPIIERALYGLAAILVGMGIRRMVKTLLPPDEDHMDKNNG